MSRTGKSARAFQSAVLLRIVKVPQTDQRAPSNTCEHTRLLNFESLFYKHAVGGMDVSVPLHTESEDNTLTRHANWRVALTNLERIRDVDLHHRHASLLDPFTPLVLQIRPSQPSARIKNNASITACTSTAEEATNEVLIV